MLSPIKFYIVTKLKNNNFSYFAMSSILSTVTDSFNNDYQLIEVRKTFNSSIKYNFEIFIFSKRFDM